MPRLASTGWRMSNRSRGRCPALSPRNKSLIGFGSSANDGTNDRPAHMAESASKRSMSGAFILGGMSAQGGSKSTSILRTVGGSVYGRPAPPEREADAGGASEGQGRG